ncbi:MAG: hypothetical protein WDO56_14490 [Gammaproteobacteria bacterium]
MNEIAQALAPNDLLVWVWRLVVWVSAAFLLALSALVFIRPAVVHRFYDGFVASQRIDFVELALRLIVSLAFIAVSPETKLPLLFFWSGAMLAITALPMMFLHRFQRRQAVWAVPFAKRILPLMGISGIALGGLIVWATIT